MLVRISKNFRLVFATGILGVLTLGDAVAANSCVVCIDTPFINLENRGINSLGFTSGEFLRVGANAVTPNGASGTTGTAVTVNTSTGQTVNQTIFFSPAPVIPNFFQRLLTINPNLLGPYSLNFKNGAVTESAVVQLPSNATVAPFVQSVTLSGTSANPTFSWAPPPGVVNGYRINLYDKSLVSATNSGNVSTINVAANVTSHSVTAADFTTPGYAFTLGKAYSIEIGVIQTRDGTSNNLGNGNLASISRTYADFTPNNGNGPPVNLPVVLANGAFQFNMAVVPNQVYYIDPAVATGYDYNVGAGNPNFASVALPTNVAGNFKLYTRDVNGNLVFQSALVGGQVYNFGASGVSFFEVTGIDPAAGLDPSNTTAFVTALTFTSAGTFNGTQTPITLETAGQVPLPGTLALLALGCLALVGGVRRKRN
jgi:hypothetical protein